VTDEGLVALVSGAAGALGAEVARTLSQRGHRLLLLDSDAQAQRLEQLAASLGGAAWVTGDASVELPWKLALARSEQVFGEPPTLAALVAGAWRGGTPLHEETSDETWRGMMTANTETVYRGLRALLPSMVARQRGSVVVVGSKVVEQPAASAGAAAYAASKAAVVAMAKSVAAEVSGHGVRVNAVLPSTLDTPANRRAMPTADGARWVSLGSAAGVIAFLLSDGARDIRGASIAVYGRA
jgi:NAD(P)-dependent dehydrogenase (short-subunit alcohol dehydrogenase family)